MKPGIPWSIKGIQTQAREAAKHAARESGLTLGEWLNSVILEQVEGESRPMPKAKARRPIPKQATPADNRARPEVHAKLGDLAEQIKRLSRQEETALGRYHETRRQAVREPDLSAIFDRIGAHERETAEALMVLNDRLVALSDEIARAISSPAIEQPEDVPGYAALESALRSIIDHMAEREASTRDALDNLQERLSAMADSEELLQASPTFTRLGARLEELSSRLECAEFSVQNDLPQHVAAELARLAQRIDRTNASFETVGQQVQRAATEAAQHELRDIEARIRGLLREAQNAMATSAGRDDDVERLKTSLGSLNQRLDDVKTHAASARDLHALRIAVEQISVRVAQGPDLRPLAEMDRKLAEITQQLEQRPVSDRLGPRLTELQQHVEELDRRLAEALSQNNDRASFATLERHIKAIADRVGGAEQQLGQMVHLEQAIRQLYDGLQQSRDWAREVAEDAAKRMADRVMQSPEARPAEPSPELRAFEQELEAVSASAAAADRRNQETLQAVHETLEHIVSRLAGIEAAAERLQDAPPEASAPTPLAEPAGESYAPAAFNAFGSSTESGPPPIGSPGPLEPGSGLGEQVAAPSVQSRPAEPEPPRDDFIAAARRAARAAAEQSNGSLTSGMGFTNRATGKVGAVPQSRSPFSLLFWKRGQAQARSEPAAGASEQTRTSGRRAVMLAGLILLAVASIVTFTGLVNPSPPLPHPTPPAEDRLEPSTTPKQKLWLGAAKQPASNTQAKQSNAQEANSMQTAALPAIPPGQDSPIAATRELPPPELGAASLRKAAADGNPAAQFVIAGRYLEAAAGDADPAKAAHWYRKAAAQGLAPAQYRLGTLYERGKGVAQDIALARMWYERAAERGNVRSMHNAAVIYAGNQAGPAQFDKAAHWFGAAAAYGLKDSQFNLAVLYERGMGVARDSSKAYFWYSLAARQNDPDAAAKAKALAHSLTPEAVAELTNRLDAWRTKEPSAEANAVAINEPDWQSPDQSAEAYASPVLGASIDAGVMSASPVAQAQGLLARLGYDVGPSDGRLNANTVKAIKQFQRESGMKATGIVTPDLLTKLEAKSS